MRAYLLAAISLFLIVACSDNSSDNGQNSELDYKVEKIYPVDSNIKVYKIVGLGIDKENKVWFYSKGADGGQLLCYDGTSVKEVVPPGDIFQYMTVNSIDFDRDNNIFLSMNSLAVKYDGSNWKQIKFCYPNNSRSDLTLSSFAVDSLGNVWYAVSGLGLVLAKDSLEKYRPSFDSSALLAKLTTCAFDRNNTLWAGGTDCNLVKIQDNKLRVYSHNNIFTNTNLTSYINLIGIDSYDNLWLRAVSFIRFNENKKEWVTFTSCHAGKPFSTVYCMMNDLDNRMWVSTNQGISIYNGSGWNSVKDTYDKSILKIVQQDRHTVWAVSSNGLFKITI